MIFVEIHAQLAVHRMLFAALKIINQYAHVNKATMEIQKYNVFELDVDQMMNAHPHTIVLIDNVFQLVLPIRAVTKLNAMALITLLFVNVLKDLMVIQRSVAMLSVVEVMMNARQTKPVSIQNAKAHARKLQSVNEMKSVVFIIINQNAVAHQERFQKKTVHADNMMNCAVMTAIAHHKRLVLTANV